MINKLNKESVLLFIGIGILIVIFLNYNNIILYKLKDKINENFEEATPLQIDDTLPTFIKGTTSDNVKMLVKNNHLDTLLNKFIQYLIPYEKNDNKPTTPSENSDSYTDVDDDKSTTNARYNILNLYTKNFKNEIKKTNFVNNMYKINKNIFEGNNNVFVNKEIDLRLNNEGIYNKNIKKNIINLANGLNFKIDFILNYLYPNSNNIPVNITIKENTLDFFGNNITNINDKTYHIDELIILPILNENENGTIDTDDLNYGREFHLIMQLPTNHFNTVNNIKNEPELYHQFIIKIILKKSIIDISLTNNNFTDLINNIDIYKSKLYYNVYNNENFNENNKVFSFECNYIINILNSSGDLNEYTKNKLEIMHKETLNDNYNEIISNLFNMDNKLTEKEKIIQTMKKHYLYNELSNLQNNMQFYNTF